MTIYFSFAVIVSPPPAPLADAPPSHKQRKNVTVLPSLTSSAQQAFLPSRKLLARPLEHGSAAAQPGSMQESLLGKPQSHASPHAHSEFDAETSFVVWEHEKEALQARLSQKRERLFR